MYIHGHNVDGDEDGIHYLRHLDPEESRVLFEYAKKRGQAEFESRVSGVRRNYALKYDNYRYSVESQGAESGGGWL
jgi:hypothetical protein